MENNEEHRYTAFNLNPAPQSGDGMTSNQTCQVSQMTSTKGIETHMAGFESVLFETHNLMPVWYKNLELL